MNLDLFLSPADAARAVSTLRHLARHDLSRFALTGGFAIESQIHTHGGQPHLRTLHDIDFLVDSFRDLPPSLGTELLRHIHPHDPPAKTLSRASTPPPPSVSTSSAPTETKQPAPSQSPWPESPSASSLWKI